MGNLELHTALAAPSLENLIASSSSLSLSLSLSRSLWGLRGLGCRVCRTPPCAGESIFWYVAFGQFFHSAIIVPLLFSRFRTVGTSQLTPFQGLGLGVWNAQQREASSPRQWRYSATLDGQHDSCGHVEEELGFRVALNPKP